MAIGVDNIVSACHCHFLPGLHLPGMVTRRLWRGEAAPCKRSGGRQTHDLATGCHRAVGAAGCARDDAAAIARTVSGRLDALEPVLNAFTHVDRDGALAAATAATARQAAGARLGPLDGIPVSVKDNIFVAGLPARWGSLLFREHIPDRDDICVERLRAAGAVIVGKAGHVRPHRQPATRAGGAIRLLAA